LFVITSRVFGRVLPCLFASVLLAAACSDGSSTDESAEDGFDDPVALECTIDPDPVFDPDSPTEVVVWHPYVATQLSTFESLVAEFNESHPGIGVAIEFQGDQNETLAKVQQGLPLGDLPALVAMGDWNTQFMIDSGAAVPAQACIDAGASGAERFDELLPSVRSAFSVNEALWPVAFALATEILVVNEAHFEQAGLDPADLPGTLDELEAAALAIQEAGVTEVPMVLRTDPWKMEFWVTGARETVVDNDNGHAGVAEQSTFENPASIEAMEWLAHMQSEGLLKVEAADPGNINHLLAMGTGQASMVLESSGAITAVAAVIEAGSVSAIDVGDIDVPDIDVSSDFSLGVGPYPGISEPGKGQIGGSVWYLTNTVPPLEQAAAWEFVTWFNQREPQIRWYVEGSNIPAWSDLAEDPAVADAARDQVGGDALAVAFDALATLDPDFTGPIIGPYDEVRASVQESMERVLLNGQDPTESVAQADTEIRVLLEDYANAQF
jgi:sn-glycerol 3-phosphate transport system substrate-binding protein